MKLAFLGTGNMGGALARAASLDTSNELFLVNRHPEKAEKLQQEIGGTVSDQASAVAAAIAFAAMSMMGMMLFLIIL